MKEADLKNLEGLTHLEIVNLTDCPVGDKATEFLAKIPNLQRVRIEGTRITDEGVKHLGRVPKLVELHVQRTNVTGTGFATWRDSPLAHLTIGEAVTNEGAKHIAALLNLRALLISSRLLDDDSVKRFAALRLGSLILDSPKITDKGVEALAALPGLSTLILDNLGATAGALKTIAALPGLAHLVVSGDWVTDEGVGHLRGTELYMLSLAPRGPTPVSRNVTDAAVKHVAEMKNLGILNLDHTGVTDACIPDLLRTKRLVALSLHNTKVTNDGLWKLKQGLPKCDVQPQPTGAAPADPEVGFVSLFNGKDLTEWTSIRDLTAFKVDGSGNLVITGDAQAVLTWLVTEKEYSDFVLRLDFQFAQKLPQHVDSGVTFRALPERSGVQGAKLRVSLNNDPNFRHPLGAVVYTAGDAVKPPDAVPFKGAGEWNTLEIEAIGSRVRVSVNGKLVNDVDLSKIDRDTISPKEGYARADLDRKSGRIGLQSHRGVIKYRNIRVKELSKP